MIRRMRTRFEGGLWPAVGLLLPLICLVSGCSKGAPAQSVYPMGERAVIGTLSYNVVQTVWKSQLGELFNLRSPQNRFLLITLSATNGGASDVALPFFTLEGPNGKEVKELENGEGVDNWFGLLRTLKPAENHQGIIVFDAPLTSYRLRLTDGGEPGTEKLIWVEIPLRIDTDTNVAVPTPTQR